MINKREEYLKNIQDRDIKAIYKYALFVSDLIQKYGSYDYENYLYLWDEENKCSKES